MADIWVTPRSCSDCSTVHAENGEECDCWCHDDDGPDGSGDWEW
jgi:hypothetical protein